MIKATAIEINSQNDIPAMAIATDCCAEQQGSCVLAERPWGLMLSEFVSNEHAEEQVSHSAQH